MSNKSYLTVKKLLIINKHNFKCLEREIPGTWS